LAKCPECGAEITYLKNFCFNATVEYKWSVTPNGSINCDEQTMTDYDEEEYWCPVCDAILTTSEDEAKDILLSGTPQVVDGQQIEST